MESKELELHRDLTSLVEVERENVWTDGVNRSGIKIKHISTVAMRNDSG